MGTSTDAILYWGIELGEESRDWDETGNLEVDSHCSGDYPMYYAYYGEYRYLASRGYPVDIPSELPLTTEAMKNEVREFCAKNNIEYVEPQWRLCSDWIW